MRQSRLTDVPDAPVVKAKAKGKAILLGQPQEDLASPDGLVTFQQLRRRGWTEALVERFLEKPDSWRPNPVYASQEPMRLWRASRVLVVEQNPRFLVALRASRKRSETGKEVSKRLAQEAVAWARQARIRLRPVEDLRAAAIRAYNARSHRDWDWRPATEGSDPAFLERIMVNFARHELSAYEHLLDERYGKVGVEEAQAVVRERVYEAIAEAHPELAAECRRQLEVRRRNP